MQPEWRSLRGAADNAVTEAKSCHGANCCQESELPWANVNLRIWYLQQNVVISTKTYSSLAYNSLGKICPFLMKPVYFRKSLLKRNRSILPGSSLATKCVFTKHFLWHTYEPGDQKGWFCFWGISIDLLMTTPVVLYSYEKVPLRTSPGRGSCTLQNSLYFLHLISTTH